ncbi:MAG: HNH endonuclease [Cellulomonas sp.]|uniref:HNH endonuclease n=1 Tax=Cellulomonas sp. TaxID=40001 RepID=UPI00258887B9|nr:HNH endonuclease [Cellulomonas sp.]MCR6706568.1 HNH endonuclease [Cellulomonas sp.]
MPFFQVDDRLHANRKARALTGRMLAGDDSGLAALGVWTLAGSQSQDVGTDGLVSLQSLMSLVFDRSAALELARLLVDAGLWHAPGHDCDRCDPVPAEDPVSGVEQPCWRFHDWWALKYDPAAVVRETRAKRAELQDPATVNSVWLRDCIDPLDPVLKAQANCRYCGRLVKRADRSSKDENARATLDHVDPTKAKGVRNLVVACGGCNRAKGRRTPAEAGMNLRPAPRRLTPAQEAVAAAETSPSVPLAAEVSPAPSSQQTAVRASSKLPPEHSSEHSSKQPPIVSSGARTGVRTGARPGQGQGQGQVLGEGSGEGQAPGSAPRPRPRRRRRGQGGRGRGPDPAQTLDAGPTPESPPAPGRYGSPWHAYRGPRDPMGDETHCPMHHLPEPCRKCPTGGEA